MGMITKGEIMRRSGEKLGCFSRRSSSSSSSCIRWLKQANKAWNLRSLTCEHKTRRSSQKFFLMPSETIIFSLPSSWPSSLPWSSLLLFLSWSLVLSTFKTSYKMMRLMTMMVMIPFEANLSQYSQERKLLRRRWWWPDSSSCWLVMGCSWRINYNYLSSPKSSCESDSGMFSQEKTGEGEDDYYDKGNSSDDHRSQDSDHDHLSYHSCTFHFYLGSFSLPLPLMVIT